MKNKTKNIIITVLILIILSLLGFIGFYYFKNKKLPTNIQEINPLQDNLLNNNTSLSFSEDTDFYSIKASYPDDPIDKEKVLKADIESKIAKAKEDWKIGGEIYNSEQKLSKDFPDRPKMKYEKNISYKKYVSQKNNTVTYVLEDYEFTGGAHGGTNVYTYTFNKDKRLKIEDIINFDTNNNDIALTKILKNSLLKVLGDDTDQDMLNNGLGLAFVNKNGIFDKAKCDCDGFFFPSNFQNFIILDEGIKFIMGQYAVAPYSSGMPEAIISWQELKPFLKMFNN